MKLSSNPLFSPRGLPRCARFVSVGLLLAALAFHVAAGQTDRSILRVAAAGVGLPPADHDFTRLAPGHDFNSTNLLVRFAPGVESTQRAQILNSLGGARVVRDYELVSNLCLVELPAGQTVQQALLSYNANSGIFYAEPNYVVHVDATIPNDPRFSELWGMHNAGQTGGTPGADIHATDAWDITTGSRQIVVAVIDTGVDYTHPDLTNNIWTNPGEIPGNGIDDDGNGFVDDVHGYDFYDRDGDPMDGGYHGTHVSGTIGGEGNNGIGVAGVCWKVRIMAVRFLGPFGGFTADAISSIQYATLMRANVMNNSWGGGPYEQALKDAIDAAGAAGIIFTASAGNDGTDNDIIPQYPSSYTSSNIISVMSTDHNDLRSSFSCFGLTSVDLAAPGSEILSCQPGGGYQYMSGTSMATPHVSGACALLLAANPTLTVAEVKNALLSTVDPVVPGLCVSGGRLNVFRALPSLLPQNPLVLYTNYLTGGNGNGIVEFDECNSLSLILTNVGTTNVTGINATLSTATPGVAIAQGTSSYAGLPVGGLGTNLVPFKFSTVPSFVCGTPIDFTLLLRSDQGVSITQFSLPTGVPGTPRRFDNNSVIAIPSPGFANSTVSVSNITTAINKVTVSLFVTESFPYFLTLDLIAPDGTTCTLTANNGLIGEDYGQACGSDSQRTTFDDAALNPISSGLPPFIGSFKPSKALAVFAGKSGTNVNGVWQLRATDSGLSDLAAIQCWSLFISPTLCADGGGQCPGADMALGMASQPPTVIAGNNLTYRMAVTNLGPSTTANVTVTHLLPPTVTFVTASASQGSYSQQGGVITFSLGPMAPRGEASLAVIVQADDIGTNYTMFSTAAVSSEQPDFSLGNNSATVRTQVTPATADLAVAIAAVPNPALVQGTLTYTVSLTNNGPSPASAIIVTNALPSSASIQSVTVSRGTTTVLGNVILWSLTNKLVMGASATATITVTPTAEGLITATVTAGAGQFDPITANNTATVTTTVGPAADLAISLTPNSNVAVAGGDISYQVSVVNLGPSPATGVIVNNFLPPSFRVSSTAFDQGSTQTNNSTVIWDVGSLAGGAQSTLWIQATTSTNGTFIVTATASAAQADPNPANNSASVPTVVTPPFTNIVGAVAILTYESGPTNGAVDLGETVTMNFTLRNEGNVAVANLQAALLATNGVVPATNTWLPCGTVLPGALSDSVTFTFTATNFGSTISPTLHLQGNGTDLPPVSFTFALPNTLVFANTNGIVIPDPAASNYPPQSGPGKPYPSTIAVSGLTGVVGKVTATLSNLNHTFPGDVNALLVAPGGTKTLLMSHAGTEPAVPGVNLTFDDFAANALPEFGQLAQGTYRPAKYGSAPAFPTNAPPGSYPALLSEFNGISPNGNWSLYLLDDGIGDEGAIVNGWSLALTMVTPVNKVADLAVRAIAATNSILVGQTITYTFTITNYGPNPVAYLAFNTTLPVGVTVKGTVPTATATNGQTLTFTNLGTLATGAYTNVTVVVTPDAAVIPQGLTNINLITTANVAIVFQKNENLVEVNLANNAVTVATAVNSVADLGFLAQTVAPDPVVVGYSLTNTVTITNHGPCAGLNAVLEEKVPPGAGFVAASSSSTVGTLAIIGGTNITCNLGDLEPNASATITLVLTNSAPGSMTNTVSLRTGAYDPMTNNNSTTRVVTVVGAAPLIISAGGALVYETGPTNGLIDPGETVTLSLALANVGSLETLNLVATLLATNGVTDNQPAAGYTTLLTNAYGRLLQAGASATRSFTFKAASGVSSTTVATLQLRDERPGVTNALGQVAFLFLSPPRNPAAITIPNYGLAIPYPSIIVVSDLTGQVTKATVTLHDLTHSFPQDINALLVSPTGANVLLMSHAGGAYAVTSPVTLTFDDNAPNTLPSNGLLTTRTYRPGSYPGTVAFPAPASPGPYGSTLAAINGSDPNGRWFLYVFDDAVGDAGSIAGGWSLTLETGVPAELSGSITTNGDFHLILTAQPGVAYVIEASTNLTSWVSLSTNTVSPGGTTEFTDTNAPSFKERFYRSRQLTP